MLRRFSLTLTRLAQIHYQTQSVLSLQSLILTALHMSHGTVSSNCTNTSTNNDHSSSTLPKRKIQVAIVGSGPSGCFVANTLIKRHPCIHVDLYEKLPVPFGLSRYGVAPDHPEVKNVEEQFMKMFDSGKVTWIGNIHIGKDLPLPLLLEHYAAVVLATGAESSNLLQIPQESLGNVINARDLVHYYNTLPFPMGSPRFSPFDVDDRIKRVIVIGNGNVAIDTSRVLSGSYQYFAPTDMNCEAIKAFVNNHINHIDVIARRGPAFSAFTIAEFRELTRFQAERVSVKVDHFDLPYTLSVQSPRAVENPRAFKRIMEFVHKFTISPDEMSKERQMLATDANGQLLPQSEIITTESTSTDKEVHATQHEKGNTVHAKEIQTQSVSPLLHERGPCTIRFRYHLKPIKFIPNPLRRNYVGGVLFEYTEDVTNNNDSNSNNTTTNHVTSTSKQYCVIPCDLVIKSIGFHAEPLESSSLSTLPFSYSSHGAIANTKGRVNGLSRVYCAGWARNGGKGVIVHSMADAQEVVASILEDLAKIEQTPEKQQCESNTEESNSNESNLQDKKENVRNERQAGMDDSTHNTSQTSHKDSKPTMYGKYGLLDYFVEKKLEPVSVEGVKRIFNVEHERGVDLGKRLEKISTVRDMLDIAMGGNVGQNTERRIRGFTPIRSGVQSLLHSFLLDDDSNNADMDWLMASPLSQRIKEMMESLQTSDAMTNDKEKSEKGKELTDKAVIISADDKTKDGK